MAKQTVRFNMNISPEAAEKLEKLAELPEYKTKTAAVEAAINRLYEEKGDK